MVDSPHLTVVYRPDDFEPAFLDKATRSFFGTSAADAQRAGFQFRAIAHHELIPGCDDRPQLWHDGHNLLEERQLFQVDDFSWDSQADHHLHAIRHTVQASTSILLNQHFAAAAHLATDKLSIVQHAAQLGVPAPATVAVPFGRYARTALPLIEKVIGAGPYILKPRELGMGFAVLKADTLEQLTAAIDIAAQTGRGYVAQPFLPNRGDLRVYIVDGNVVTEHHRLPSGKSYLANGMQGGTHVPDSHVAEATQESVRIAQSLTAACLQTDWLLTNEGPVVNEWSSGFGGYSSLPAAQRTQVGDAYFAWMRALWLREATPAKPG